MTRLVPDLVAAAQAAARDRDHHARVAARIYARTGVPAPETSMASYAAALEAAQLLREAAREVTR